MSSHAPTLSDTRTRVLDRPANTVLRFTEFAPPEELCDRVEGVAVVTIPPEAPARQWRIIPDARCRLWLPFTRSAVRTFQPAPFRHRDVATPPPGTAAMVRFTPEATGALGVGEDGRPPKWWDGAAEAWRPPRAVGADQCYRAVCRWLRRVLPPERPDPRLTLVWRTLAANASTDAEELSRAAHTSTRTLRRLTHEASGCTLRTARQLERLRAALRLLRRDLRLPWTAAALEAGYCDQSHLYRAFRRWAGMAPSEFFARGHHHLNDVFARQVDAPRPGDPLRALGAPVLRPAAPPRFPVRDGRRSQARRRATAGRVLPALVAAIALHGATLHGATAQEPPDAGCDHAALQSGTVYYCVAGRGPDVIVLNAGARLDSRTWRGIVAPLAEAATVITFDRLGLGRSGAGTTPRTPANIADELASLLEGIRPGPYLLVGHSAGGVHMMWFASRYPRLTRGVVLLDTPGPRFDRLRWDLLTPAERLERQRLLDASRQAAPVGVQQEYAGAAGAPLLEPAAVSDTTRVVVLSATTHNFGPHGDPEAHERLWQEGQREWLAYSHRAELVLADGATHMIHRDRPDLVVRVVREFLRRAVRTR